jgi:hypothetical protein
MSQPTTNNATPETPKVSNPRGSTGVLADLAVVGLHTLAMFVVMGVIAMVVYEKLGVIILKRTWFNLDLLWAGALVGAGFITLVV